MALRNKSKTKVCQYCNKLILKGQWYWIHDNIFNDKNPKIFCSQKCKLRHTLLLSNTKTLENFV